MTLKKLCKLAREGKGDNIRVACLFNVHLSMLFLRFHISRHLLEQKNYKRDKSRLELLNLIYKRLSFFFFSTSVKLDKVLQKLLLHDIVRSATLKADHIASIKGILSICKSMLISFVEAASSKMKSMRKVD